MLTGFFFSLVLVAVLIPKRVCPCCLNPQDRPSFVGWVGCWQGAVPHGFSMGWRVLLPADCFVVLQGVFSGEVLLDFLRRFRVIGVRN